MNAVEHVSRFLEHLHSLEIPFMITGSLASNLYGVPRSTLDADIVVQLEGDDLARLIEAVAPAFEMERQVTFESVTMTTRYVFRSDEYELKVELFLLSDDPHDRERFARRKKGNLSGYSADVPTAEDVIVAKIRWIHHANRSKDLEDVRNVISIQDDRLDWDYIHRWCTEHGTLERLEEIRKSIPDV